MEPKFGSKQSTAVMLDAINIFLKLELVQGFPKNSFKGTTVGWQECS